MNLNRTHDRLIIEQKYRQAIFWAGNYEQIKNLTLQERVKVHSDAITGLKQANLDLAVLESPGMPGDCLAHVMSYFGFGTVEAYLAYIESAGFKEGFHENDIVVYSQSFSNPDFGIGGCIHMHHGIYQHGKVNSKWDSYGPVVLGRIDHVPDERINLVRAVRAP